MTRPKSTIAEQLAAAEVAVNNSLADPEIMALVGEYGYTNEKLLEGTQLFAAAQAAVAAQEQAAGAQQGATGAFKIAQAEAFDAYQALSKVARAAAPKSALAGLGLTGPMPRSTAAFQTAARSLFTNAASLPTLAEYGYTASKLQAETAKLTAFEEANRRQEAAKGAAQQATREQDAALAALNKWLAQYVKIARVALRSKRELLEKLGVAARAAA